MPVRKIEQIFVQRIIIINKSSEPLIVLFKVTVWLNRYIVRLKIRVTINYYERSLKLLQPIDTLEYRLMKSSTMNLTENTADVYNGH